MIHGKKYDFYLTENGSSTAGLNMYEERRLANIARNHQALRDLGLSTTKESSGNSTSTGTLLKPRRREQNSNTTDTPPQPSRFASITRSAQLAALSPQQIKPEIDPGKRARKSSAASTSDKEDEDGVKHINNNYYITPTPTAYSTEAVEKCGIRVSTRNQSATLSSKNINARINEIDQAWLGKILLPPAGSGSLKEAAMYAIGEHPPRFSKYSGIQEFANAVILFVNAAEPSVIQGPKEQKPKYVNTFYRNSEADGSSWLMPWFAQDRHRADTPIIARLQGMDPIFLMCRIPGEAYVCCGRLKLKEVSFNRSPIRFVWTLLRSELLDAESEAWHQLLMFSGCNRQPIIKEEVGA